MNNLTGKQILYLLLALAGAVGTWYYNLQVTDMTQFFTLAWEHPVTSSITVDILVAALTFVAFLIIEGRRVGLQPWLIGLLLVLTGTVAFAFSFPLFLFFRERALALNE